MPANPTGDGRIPVSVLTGFLGSGKTTVLRHILGSPAFADTAVLINEFGSVGLDHLLVGSIDSVPLLLENGCICCSIRGDLSRALRDLLARRQRDEIPPFRRVVMETTGLADPTPILATITSDLVLRRHLQLGNVVCTIDAVHAECGLEQYGEIVKQIAVADRLLVTKTDLVPEIQVRRLSDLLSRINPGAVRTVAVHGAVDRDLIMGEGLHNPQTRLIEVQRWLAAQASQQAPPALAHAVDIRAFVIRDRRPLDWNAFGLWFSLLVHRHGNRLLRVKGLLAVEDSITPVMFHAVQHVIHQPEHLTAWPTSDRTSSLVFIVDGLDGAVVQRSFSAFSRLGRTSPKPGQLQQAGDMPALR